MPVLGYYLSFWGSEGMLGCERGLAFVDHEIMRAFWKSGWRLNK